MPADFCSEEPSFILAIAINTFERQTHADAPAQFEVDLDTNHDGQVDYAVFNFDLSLSGSLSDGRNLTHVLDVASGQTSAFFFTEHDTNSANTLLLLCGEQIGMDADNFGHPINATAFAIDWFNHGVDADFGIRDVIEKLVITPMGERYLGVFAEGGVGATLLPGRTFDFLSVIELGATPANRGELGLLLFYRAGAPDGREAGVVLVKQ